MANADLAPVYKYNYMPSAATTTIKTGPGVLHSIVVNNIGSAGTITVFDNTAGSGTTIATILTQAASTTYLYDVGFSTGLTITTGGTTAPNITVSYF
jgi:thymidine phosphorylase